MLFGEHRGLRDEQFAHGRDDLLVGELVAAPRGEHRVEDQRHFRIVGHHLRDRGDDLDAAQQPDLEHAHGHVLEDAARLVATHSASSGITSSTPTVSCTVIAVITDSGWQPRLARVSRSALQSCAAAGVGCRKGEHDRRGVRHAGGWRGFDRIASLL